MHGTGWTVTKANFKNHVIKHTIKIVSKLQHIQVQYYRNAVAINVADVLCALIDKCCFLFSGVNKVKSVMASNVGTVVTQQILDFLLLS